MSIFRLDGMLQPRSVAVIGASEKKGTIGCSLMDNILNGGYQGKVYPVNPKYPSVRGLPAFRSVSNIGEAVDLAVVGIPIAGVPDIVEDCVRAKVAGAVVISAGGKEIGDRGRDLEAAIKREADKGGLRIIGPNCMGVISSRARLNASFGSLMPLKGRLGFVSQSGAMCGAILDISNRERIGFSYFISIGSMLDVDFGDLINYMGNDSDVKSIILYIENLTNIRKFMSAARAVSRIKPIVVLKAGRSKAGAQAASSHTGAMAGEDAVYDAAFKRAGVVRVNTIQELFDCAELLAKQPVPSGPGLGIVTNGGGPGVMAADALSTHGLEPVALGAETQERLDRILPPHWSRGNPMDILGDATPERWSQAMDVCLAAKEIQALMIIFVPQALTDARAVADAVAARVNAQPHPPIFAVWMGGENVAEAIDVLNRAGIPTYETPEQAVSAFTYMYAYGLNQQLLRQIPPKMPSELHFNHAGARILVDEGLKNAPLLSETESKALLRAYGIPVNPTEVAESGAEAVQLARKMGYPVAMKIHSRDIVHKTDARAVQLDLRSDADVEQAFSRIMTNARAYKEDARLLGVAVQPMLRRYDYELILGSKRDPDFGPVILFGMGGIMTEILKDQAIALPPLNRLLARRLMEETRVHRLLKGYRNRPPANLDLLEEILIRLSQLVTDFPEIVELDINPLILYHNEACAVDARVILKPSEVQAPQHLAISPYPNQYEWPVTTKTGTALFIRPIKPEDAPMLEDLFHTLSWESRYHRFFTPLKSLSPEVLASFTQIDYDRDMALVALEQGGSSDKILGVARIMTTPGGTDPEFAVTVGDPWQGQGVGACLMDRLLAIARDRGLEYIWGIVLAENTQMLAMARKFGFTVKRAPGGREYELRIDLKSVPTS